MNNDARGWVEALAVSWVTQFKLECFFDNLIW